MDARPSPLARVRAPARARRADSDARLAAVLAHLEVLLDTRAGSSLLDPTYGLPDLTDLTHACAPDGGALAARICDCVRRHEPRLTDVRVHARAPAVPAALAFTLTAALVDGTPLRLYGQLERGTRVALRGEDA